MKNLIPLLFLGSMVFMTSAYGQFGVKIGGNLSAAGSYGNSEKGEDADMKLGYQGGVFYHYTISEKLSLMAELNYEARGTISKKDYTIDYPVVDPGSGNILGIGSYDVEQEINSVQNYINIPILAVFGGEKFKYYVGPNFGFFINGKATFDRTIDVSLGGNPVNKTNTSIDDVDWKDYDSFKAIFTSPPPEDGDFLNTFEFGINIGAMYYVTESIFVDLRVNQGLTDVTNNHYDNSIYPDPTQDFIFPSREDTDRNVSIQLSVGYSFQ